jgi:hypothetical protein
MDLTFAPRQIEFWPIERLRPYARNAKMHAPDQVARIAASMARFGWTVPCMVGDDGNLRVKPDEGRIDIKHTMAYIANRLHGDTHGHAKRRSDRYPIRSC